MKPRKKYKVMIPLLLKRNIPSKSVPPSPQRSPNSTQIFSEVANISKNSSPINELLLPTPIPVSSLRNFRNITPIADTMPVKEMHKKTIFLNRHDSIPGVGDYEIKFPDKKPYCAFIPKTVIPEKPSYSVLYKESISIEATKAYIKLYSKRKSAPNIAKRLGRNKNQCNYNYQKSEPNLISAYLPYVNNMKTRKYDFLRKVKDGYRAIKENKDKLLKLKSEVKKHMSNFYSMLKQQ